MKPVGVVRFLGTNCDRDVWEAVKAVGLKPKWCWHEDLVNVDEYSSFIIPGGFSYGDYLRTGAFAARSKVMECIKEAADKNKPILGICNGFQILCEAGLLPGALLKNNSQKFIDKWASLKLINKSNFWDIKSETNLPIAHGEGRYYIDEKGLSQLKENNQVWLKYSNNPNGSVDDIAGIMNKNKNIVGLMPHPERALFSWMGGDNGFSFFKESLK